MKPDPSFPQFVARSLALAITLAAIAFGVCGAVTWILCEVIQFNKH